MPSPCRRDRMTATLMMTMEWIGFCIVRLVSKRWDRHQHNDDGAAHPVGSAELLGQIFGHEVVLQTDLDLQNSQTKTVAVRKGKPRSKLANIECGHCLGPCNVDVKPRSSRIRQPSILASQRPASQAGRRLLLAARRRRGAPYSQCARRADTQSPPPSV